MLQFLLLLGELYITKKPHAVEMIITDPATE